MKPRPLVLFAVVSLLVGGCANPSAPTTSVDPRFASAAVPWTFMHPSDWEISTKRSKPDARLKAGVLTTYVASVPYPLEGSFPGPNSGGGASAELGASAAVVMVQLLWYPANEPIPWNPPESAPLTNVRGPSRWHEDAQNLGWAFRERRVCVERACAWVLEWHGPDTAEDVVRSLQQIAESLELSSDWTDPTM